MPRRGFPRSSPNPTQARLRSGLRAWARALVASTLLACAGVAAQADFDALLKQADSVKTARYPEFKSTLEQLQARRSELGDAQRDYLQYLEGWQLAYVSDYEAAVATLTEVASRTKDPTLRFRVEASTANVLTIARRYQTALKHLNAMLVLLPTVRDPEVRGQGLLTAAQIHTQVGQHDIALDYADRLIREMPAGKVACAAMQLRIEARFRMGRLERNDVEARQAVASCVEAGELIFANLIRTVISRVDIRANQPDDAIALLTANYDEVLRTRYVRLIADYEALLAQAWWEKRDLGKSRAFAQLAVERGGGKDLTEPLVDANRLLYLIARSQGDSDAALAFHETYAAADKRFLDDIGARELAFQMVKSQEVANKLQIEALEQRNEVLNLERELGAKAVETSRLYIALLLGGLAFIAMWLYKTKRSQLHFMKLARRDGLTGVFNRAHFADAAESILDYCKKGGREACVVMIDLDHFKRVNDRHGHGAGDIVLKRTVQACQAHLRSIDIMGRLGGEEFGIVLPDCDAERATQMAEQFRLAIVGLSGHETGVGFPVSASFGVTSSSWSGYNLRQLIIHADKALYDAKRRGRNSVAMFDGSDAAPELPLQQVFDRRRA